MKKKLTLLALVILCFNATSSFAQDDNFSEFFFKTTGVDSIITEEADQNSGILGFSSLEKYTYNAQCNISKIETKQWKSRWIDSTQAVFTRDAQGRTTVSLVQVFRNGAFKDSSRQNFIYSGTALEATSITEQVLKGTTWTNHKLQEFTYTAAKKVATETIKEWIGTPVAWVNKDRTIYTFDVQNRITSELQASWDGIRWGNSSRKNYTYNAQGKLQTIKNEDWVNTWLLSDSLTFTTSTDGRRITMNFEIFGLKARTEFNGNANNALVSFRTLVQIGSNPSASDPAVLRTRLVYNTACQVVSPTQDLRFVENAAVISPNPTSDLLTIRLKNMEDHSYSATISDLSGRVIETFKWLGKEDIQRPVYHLKNGMYVLTVKGETWQTVQKFVIQH